MSIVVVFNIDLSSFCLNPLASYVYLWRFRLGHVFVSCLRFLSSSVDLGHLNTCDIFYYSGCKLEKFFTLPFSKSMSCFIAHFDIIHSDV